MRMTLPSRTILPLLICILVIQANDVSAHSTQPDQDAQGAQPGQSAYSDQDAQAAQPTQPGQSTYSDQDTQAVQPAPIDQSDQTAPDGLDPMLASCTEDFSRSESLRHLTPEEATALVPACRAAAEGGHAVAQMNYGFMHYFGFGVTPDEVEAAKWYRKAAEQGLADAQFVLGTMYAAGHGVPQSFADAARWYLAAAEQGLADAQNLLGSLFAEGEGVLQSYGEAARWYRLAADQGLAEAQFNLGSMYAMAAEQKPGDTSVDQGSFGTAGLSVAQNYIEAAMWYRLAAEQGLADAQYALGEMYAEGLGVARNFEEAARWFKLAAESGDSVSATNPDGTTEDAFASTSNAGRHGASDPNEATDTEESGEGETEDEEKTVIDRGTTVVVHPGVLPGHWPWWCEPVLRPGIVYVPWSCRTGVYWRSFHPWLFVRFNPWPHPRRRWGRDVIVVDRRHRNVRRGLKPVRVIRRYPDRAVRPDRNRTAVTSNKGRGAANRIDQLRRELRRQPDRIKKPRLAGSNTPNRNPDRGKQVSNTSRNPNRDRRATDVRAGSGRSREDFVRAKPPLSQIARQKPRSTPTRVRQSGQDIRKQPRNAPSVRQQPRNTPSVRQQPRGTPNVRKSGSPSASGRKSGSIGRSSSSGRSKRQK